MKFSEKKEAADSLKDGETVSLVLPSMMQHPKVVELGQILKDWVNDVLAPDRIIVKEIWSLDLKRFFEDISVSRTCSNCT